jgi:hypothetical protein
MSAPGEIGPKEAALREAREEDLSIPAALDRTRDMTKEDFDELHDKLTVPKKGSATQVVTTATEDTVCPTCGAFGEFGYRDDTGAMRRYCAEHKLRQFSADDHRAPPVPVDSGDAVETLPQQSLEDLTRQLAVMIMEGRRLHAKRQSIDDKMEDLRLRLGQKLLEVRRRVEAGEVSDESAIDWWGWFEDVVSPVSSISRKQAERWMAIAGADDPQAAALEYRERDASHQAAYRERKRLAAPAAPLTSEGEEHEPGAVRRLVPKRAPPLFTGHDVDESAEIEQIVALIRRLTWNGRALLMKRIKQLYDDWRRGGEVARHG